MNTEVLLGRLRKVARLRSGLVRLLREAAEEMEAATVETAGTELEGDFRRLARKYRACLNAYDGGCAP